MIFYPPLRSERSNDVLSKSPCHVRTLFPHSRLLVILLQIVGVGHLVDHLLRKEVVTTIMVTKFCCITFMLEDTPVGSRNSYLSISTFIPPVVFFLGLRVFLMTPRSSKFCAQCVILRAS